MAVVTGLSFECGGGKLIDLTALLPTCVYLAGLLAGVASALATGPGTMQVVQGGAEPGFEAEAPEHNSDPDVGEELSCAVAAAYLLLQRLGRPVPLERVVAASPAPAHAAMSMAELKKLFERLGLHAAGYRMGLRQVRGPVIAYYPGQRQGEGHFVVLEPVRPDKALARPDGREAHGGHVNGPEGVERPEWFLVLDPFRVPVRVPLDQLRERWDGRVLVVWAEGDEPLYAKRRRWWPLLALVAALTAAAVAWGRLGRVEG